jgi:hypothetical protein
MDAIKNALFSNTFDPDTEIPDLSGKASCYMRSQHGAC